MNPENSTSMLNESRKWMALAVLLLTGWLLYLMAPVLTPFVVGAVLAYLGDPLVDKLEARKIPRTFGVLIVFLIFGALLLTSVLLLIPMVERQWVLVYQNIPNFINWLNESAIPWLQERTGITLEALEAGNIRAMLEERIGDAGTMLASFITGVSSSGLAVLAWLTNLVLVPVVAFYLMRDWDHLVGNIRDLIPRKKLPVVGKLSSEIDEVLGHFLRGQLLVMISLGVIYSVGLWFIDLNVALVVGMIAGLASIVPYLGFVIGFAAAVVAAIMQFGEFGVIVQVLIVFGIGQALESMLLTPVLVGDKLGLHPVAVIFAIMAGGQLFGFVGILVALPVAAVVMVLLRHMHSNYKLSAVYDDGPNPVHLEGHMPMDDDSEPQSADVDVDEPEAESKPGKQAPELPE